MILEPQRLREPATAVEAAAARRHEGSSLLHVFLQLNTFLASDLAPMASVMTTRWSTVYASTSTEAVMAVMVGYGDGLGTVFQRTEGPSQIGYGSLSARAMLGEPSLLPSHEGRLEISPAFTGRVNWKIGRRAKREVKGKGVRLAALRVLP